MPIDFLPYIFFCAEAVLLGQLVVDVRQQRKIQLVLVAKLHVAGHVVGVTPRTWAPSFVNSFLRSRNAHASLVQPGVSSPG